MFASWRERLCGSVALEEEKRLGSASLEQILNPNENVSCGGGFFPTIRKNIANLSTPNKNWFLPTEGYSILVVKPDGNAVIYTEEEPRESQDDEAIPMLEPEPDEEV